MSMVRFEMTVASIILAVCLTIIGAKAVAQPPHGEPPRGGPPPEAIAACASQAEGKACEFNAPHGTVKGVCRSRHDKIFCVPEGGPPPAGQPSRY